jgi:hypothetical protein
MIKLAVTCFLMAMLMSEFTSRQSNIADKDNVSAEAKRTAARQGITPADSGYAAFLDSDLKSTSLTF